MNSLEGSPRVLQELCYNIKAAIKQGRTDDIKSVLEACKIIFLVLLSLYIGVTVLFVVQD
jgi:hypothetical protein